MNGLIPRTYKEESNKKKKIIQENEKILTFDVGVKSDVASSGLSLERSRVTISLEFPPKSQTRGFLPSLLGFGLFLQSQ